MVVEEPGEAESLEILDGLKKKFEDFHHVKYEDGVTDLIVKYSRRYIAERFLPDKAIDILDEAGAAKKIEPPTELAELEKTIAELSEEKRRLVQDQDYEKAALSATR